MLDAFIQCLSPQASGLTVSFRANRASRLTQVQLDSPATAADHDIWAGGLELANWPGSLGPAASIGANSLKGLSVRSGLSPSVRPGPCELIEKRFQS